MKSIRLLVVAFCLCFSSVAVIAAEYLPKIDPWLHTQPNETTTFYAIQWGHSFMMEYETDDGYTITRSASDGYWYYAELDVDGEYTPSTKKVGIDAAPAGAYHLRRSPARMAQLNDIREGIRVDQDDLAERWRDMWAGDENKTLYVAVLLIEFDDRDGKIGEVNGQTFFDKSYLQSMITDENIFNWSCEDEGAVNETKDGYSTCGSVRDYWNDISGDEINLLPYEVDDVPTLLINPLDPQNENMPIWLEVPMCYEEWTLGEGEEGVFLDEAVENGWLPEPNLEEPVDPGFDILITITAGRGWANGDEGIYPGYKGPEYGLGENAGWILAVAPECWLGYEWIDEDNANWHLLPVGVLMDEVFDFLVGDLYPAGGWGENEYGYYPRGAPTRDFWCGGIIGGFDNASKQTGDFAMVSDDKRDEPAGVSGSYWNPRDRIKMGWYGEHIELEDEAGLHIELPYSATEPTFYSYKYVDSYDGATPIYGQFFLESRRVNRDEQNDEYVDFNSRSVGWWGWDDSDINPRRRGFVPTLNENNLLIWHAEDEGSQIHVQFGDGHAYCKNDNIGDLEEEEEEYDWEALDGGEFLNGNDYFPSIDHDTEEEVTEFGPGTHQNRANLAVDYSSIDLMAYNSDTERRALQTGFCVKNIEVVEDEEEEGEWNIECDVYTNYYGGVIGEEYTLTAGYWVFEDSEGVIFLGQDCVITGDGDVVIVYQVEGMTNDVVLDSDVLVTDGGVLSFIGRDDQMDPGGVFIVWMKGYDIIVDDSGELETYGDVTFWGPGEVIVDGGVANIIGNEDAHVRFSSGEAQPAPGDWAGIHFEDLTETSTLEYVDIEYAVDGIKAVDCGNYLELDHVNITDFSSTGINLVNSSPTISNCSASDSEPSGSYYPVGLYCYNASPTVTYSNFDNNYKGAELIGVSSVIEAGYNSFSDNANCGVYFYDAMGYLYNSTGFDNGYNHIIENSSDGLWAGGVAMPYLGNGTMAQGMNSIYNNSSYEVNNQTATEIQAEYNWWGSSAGPGSIYGSVDYNPWLLISPGGGPGLYKHQEGDELIAGMDDDDDPFHRADSLFACGRFAEALRAYENLAEDVTSERLLRAVRQMRQCYLVQDRGNNWRDFIEGLIDNNRLRANLRPWIASLLAEETALNSPDDAVELIDGVLDDINQDVAAHAPLLFQMGMLQHYRQGNPRAALSTFRSFIESFEEHPLCPAAERELAACLDDPDIGDGPPPQPEEEDNKRFIPDDFVLYQPYPNPFNESVTVKYGVPEASDVIITLYDATGRVVRVLTQGQRQPGIHILQVSSATLNSGVYFCKLVASDKERTVKLICLK